MRILLFIVAILLGQLPAYSQKFERQVREIDSLLMAGSVQPAIDRINSVRGKFSNPAEIMRLDAKKAEAFVAAGQENEAEALLTQLQSDIPLIKGELYTTRGALQLAKGRSDLALTNLEQAQRIFTEANAQETGECARCLSLLGLVFSSTGKYRQAENNQLMALQIRMKIFDPESEEIAASYNDLGLVYSQTDADKALDYYEKALPIYQKLHGALHQKIAIANTNIGMTYNKLKLYGDAITSLETALAIWRKKYPEGHPNEALVLSNLGQTYLNMGNQQVAREYLEQALTIYTRFYNGKHSDIAYTHNLLGNLDLEKTDYAAALNHYQQALIANSPTFNNSDITQNPAVDSYYNAKVLLYTLQLKSQALEDLHFGKTLKIQDLELALSSIHSCDSLIDNIRHQSSDESDKLELGEISSEVYEDGVRIAYEISEMSLDFKLFRKEAFYFAEKSKAAVLLESIADADAKSFAGIPPSLLDEEKSYKAEIALLTRKLTQKPDDDEEKRLRQALYSVDLRYKSFIKQLEQNFPSYFNLKFNQTSPKIEDLQKNITNQTAIISYFIAEHGNNKRLFIFTITKEKFRIRSYTLPEDFNRLVHGLRNGLFYNDFPTFQRSAELLSNLLIPALPHSITSLIIIPTGQLSTIPFEVLTTKKIKEQDYQKIPYLVRQFNISYEFAAQLILQSVATDNKPTPSIFLCAPIDFEKENLDDLPGTEREVNTIATLFKGQSSIAKFAEANEATVKSGELTRYNYLHFATHGIVNENDPELSRLFLNASGAEDGNLYSGEIYNIRLNADLTVLSACQTGLGKISKGEGVIGLSRALVYAGAKNIIVSFWSVADESTSQLMSDFYTQLLAQKNQNFSRALQQAKLKMIENSKYAAPYYWAPFVLIGH